MNDKGTSVINLSLTVVVLLLAACGTPPPTPTPVPPTLTPVPATATPTPTNTPTPPASLAQIDREGLVAYFPFDGDATDASGNGHHGMVHGATLTTDRHGEDGRAYAFDGADDFISIPDSPDFEIGVGDMTVLLWVFREPAGGSRFQGLISHTNGAEADDGWWWTLARGRANMWVSLDDYDHIYRSGVPLDTWVHLAFARSGSELTFYVDGTALGDPVDHGRNINDSDGDLRIGMEGSTYGEFFFPGKIDEVMLYNRALTADEILAAMNAPEPAPAGASGPPRYLSQLEPQTAEVGWGTFSKGVYEFTSRDASDKIREGDPIVVHEVEYPHVLYAHAPSRLVYDLGGGFSELQATIGLVDRIACGDGTQFIILLDGKRIFTSPTMTASSAPIEIKVSVAKGQILELLTAPGSEKVFTCDWAIWGDPTLR